MLHAIVDDEVWSFQAEGWRMIDWDGRPILLIARDGVVALAPKSATKRLFGATVRC
jgi:hypothetical protein